MHKSIFNFALLAGVLLSVPSQSKAQVQRPKFHYGPLDYLMPYPSNWPPLRTDMPVDVILGYIVWDSLAKYQGSSLTVGYQIDSIIPTLGDSDTLRYALKYVYELTDYDPVAVFQYINMKPQRRDLRNVTPGFLFNQLMSRASEAIDSGVLFSSLATADAILDVRVTDTIAFIDSTKPAGSDKAYRVRCQILDQIKGQHLPSCSSVVQEDHSHDIPPDRIDFEYWYHWQRQIHEHGYYKAEPGPWVVPDSEYIVCLKIVGLGGDSTGHYATLEPSFPGSTVMGIYPVRSGVVYNPNSDFGFSDALTVADFKLALRQKISSIVSYHP